MKPLKHIPIRLDFSTGKGVRKDGKPVEFTRSELQAVVAVELGMKTRRDVARVINTMRRVESLQHLPVSALRTVNLEQQFSRKPRTTAEQAGYLLNKARRKVNGDLPTMEKIKKEGSR